MNLNTVSTLVYLVVSLVLLVVSLLMPKLAASIKLSPAQHQVVKEIADMVVPAIEQTCSLLSGPAKLQEATRVIGDLLAAANVHVSPALISTAIEAAVYAMNQSRSQAVTVLRPAVVPPTTPPTQTTTGMSTIPPAR